MGSVGRKLTFLPGQIWLSRFPYSDDPSDSKTRYVLVMGVHSSSRYQSIVVVPITTYGGNPDKSDPSVDVQVPQGILPKRSYIRSQKVWAADPDAFLGDKHVAMMPNAVMVQVLRTMLLRLFKIRI